MKQNLIRKSSILLIILLPALMTASGQVRVRLYTGQAASPAFFTVTEGKYGLTTYPGDSMHIISGGTLIFALVDEGIAVRTVNSPGFLCDSLIVNELTENSRFSLRLAGMAEGRTYSGNLRCSPDLGQLVFVNTCNVEDYVAGVVIAEGGSGRNIEYLKSQALLVRSYFYKYSGRHIIDGYNLCDNTHCQVFRGVTANSRVLQAVRSTKGLVITDRDSNLINPAFHSNCGGETSLAEDVWLSGKNYLKKVKDPYCSNSPNARWTKKYSTAQWKEYLIRSGYIPEGNDRASFGFKQPVRMPDYRVGSFSLPFSKIRNDLDLRSSFFSVNVKDDAVILEGRGYGHGVGLCQEGAMVMAARGLKFKQIIDFYYSDVIITDIKNLREGINNLH